MHLVAEAESLALLLLLLLRGVVGWALLVAIVVLMLVVRPASVLRRPAMLLLPLLLLLLLLGLPLLMVLLVPLQRWPSTVTISDIPLLPLVMISTLPILLIPLMMLVVVLLLLIHEWVRRWRRGLRMRATTLLWGWFHRTPSPRPSLVHLVSPTSSSRKISLIASNVHAPIPSLVTLAASPTATHVCNASTATKTRSSYSLIFFCQ
mmetsp:Transcript_14329/g.31275  ORF Transcript_14329/g.31275 Transcript_14329/m.31275 type:complete len:206 (-) Transcript_14329:3117-3734(-)